MLSPVSDMSEMNLRPNRNLHGAELSYYVTLKPQHLFSKSDPRSSPSKEANITSWEPSFSADHDNLWDTLRMKHSLLPNQLFLAVAMTLAGLLGPGVAMAIEEPKFVVETKKDDYEIRKYGTTLVAETEVEAEFDEAGNRAFRILADYIFGKNKTKTKIDMTAPVSQASKSEKIEMTAPVSLSKASRGFRVQFTMPSTFTMATLPEPIDPRVQLREVPERRVAVLRYSGSWSQTKYEGKLKILRDALTADGVKMIGEPIFARFNSPFQIWFLRRNEIWIEVAS